MKTPATQVFLVTNVGSKAASFTLTAEDPFKVAPSQGTLAAGDTLSCSVTFTPQAAGQSCPAPPEPRIMLLPATEALTGTMSCTEAFMLQAAGHFRSAHQCLRAGCFLLVHQAMQM